MPIVEYTFNNDLIESGAGTATPSYGAISGDFTIDYDTFKANGTVTVAMPNRKTLTFQLDNTPVSKIEGPYDYIFSFSFEKKLFSDNGKPMGEKGTMSFEGLNPTSFSDIEYVVANESGSTLYSAPAKANGVQETPPGPVASTFVCFASGTLIRTLRGEVRVEHLRIGDLVVTASDKLQPIRWLGHRTVSDGCPVRISARAFGASLPARDLYLSPGHPVLVGADEDGCGGHLVPIICLINGTTINRVPVDTVTYWHVELDSHDILLAEGLPAESYIDLGSRPWFAGADGALFDPDLALPGMAGRCRPVAIDGPVVEAERRRLDAVFAMRLASASVWPGAEDGLAL